MYLGSFERGFWRGVVFRSFIISGVFVVVFFVWVSSLGWLVFRFCFVLDWSEGIVVMSSGAIGGGLVL